MATGKKCLIFLAVLLCAALLAGPAFAKELTIGVMGPFTGPAAKTGDEIKGSVGMAFEKAGNKIGDYDVKVIWIDSQSDPAKATAAYAEAAEKHKIQMGMGNWHSSVAAACMDVAAKYQVPHIFALGASEVVNEKWAAAPAEKKYWNCKGWPTPAKLYKGYVQTIEAAIKSGKFKPAAKKVAIWGEDTDWGRSAGSGLKQYFTEAGWEIVYEDYFDIKQTDFYPMMAKYKKAGVTAIAGTCTGAATISALIKQTREVGLKALVVADGLGWVGNWYKMTGKASNYVLDMIPQLASKEAQQWAKDFEAKVGAKPSPSAAGLFYDYANFTIKILNHTLKKYGNLEKASIQKVVVEELNTGKLTYSAADGAMIMNEYKYDAGSVPDPVLGPDHYFFPVIQYMNGKGGIIFPDVFATTEFKARK
jgi:branched-chain amino acid transport system substrate-binding protein